MWVFANRLPADFLLVAPRAPYPAALGGYSWQAETTRRLPDLAELAATVAALDGLLASLQEEGSFSGADFSHIHLMGFSQGAAVAYAYSLLRPERVRSIIGLDRFMPGRVSDAVAPRPLEGKPVFVAHGSQDAIVPVARAASQWSCWSEPAPGSSTARMMWGTSWARAVSGAWKPSSPTTWCE